MFEPTFKNIDDVLWKEAGCTTELDYTEQTSWMLFLKYLDDLERERAMEAELVGKPYSYIIDEAHRWASWAAPKEPDGSFDHDTALTGDDLIAYVDEELFPHQTDRRALWHRERGARPVARIPRRHPAGESQTAARRSGTLARRPTAQNLRQVRTRQGHPLCPDPHQETAALHRPRRSGNR